LRTWPSQLTSSPGGVPGPNGVVEITPLLSRTQPSTKILS
jgi:hypothetical protein